MAIPDFQTLMLPLLELLADGEEHTPSECAEKLADRFELTEEERRSLLRSGQRVFANRVAWARVHMGKAGLVEGPRTGIWTIGSRGRELLADPPARIDLKFLRRFPNYEAFYRMKAERRKSRAQREADGDARESEEGADSQTPEDQMRAGWEEHRAALEDELIGAVKQASPAFFEQVVVDLLLAMGYGGSHAEAARAIGRSGDEGIDGFIKEDRLGLDVVYVQAKRWDTRTVGRPDIQQFVGALHGQRARKGVFITTSTFSKEAERYVEQIESKVVLIDGTALARMMADHGVGVSTVDTYEIKRLDSDYFEGA